MESSSESELQNDDDNVEEKKETSTDGIPMANGELSNDSTLSSSNDRGDYGIVRNKCFDDNDSSNKEDSVSY